VDLKARLDALVAETDVVTRREADPVGFVHRYDAPEDQEVVGLVAATLAFGNVVAIRRSVERVLEALGPSPSTRIRIGEKRLGRRLEGFVHRVYRGPHVARMLANAARLQRAGGIGVVMTEEVEAHGLREGLARVADRLRGGDAERGLRHLVPDPRAGSACKRLLLYLRWMVRPADEVDLGLWGIAPSALVMPLDTHVHRIARNLGLTARGDASWRTAEEVTARLREYDPEDPVKYDFALCHLGMSKACPSRRDDLVCAGCGLREVCVHQGATQGATEGEGEGTSEGLVRLARDRGVR